jgi:hypothetical protein
MVSSFASLFMYWQYLILHCLSDVNYLVSLPDVACMMNIFPNLYKFSNFTAEDTDYLS